MTFEERHGLTDRLIDPSCRLHHQVVGDFKALQKACRRDGFELTIASGFRSFERQLLIWNEKVLGERPLRDEAGKEVSPSQLNETQLLKALLRWSALPGLSRHHWGTDLDVFDPQLKAQVELVSAEYQVGGPYYELTLWLQEHAPSYHFFHPFKQDLGGVAPEPWHLSHQLSRELAKGFDLLAFKNFLMNQPLQLKDLVMAELPALIQRYAPWLEA